MGISLNGAGLEATGNALRTIQIATLNRATQTVQRGNSSQCIRISNYGILQHYDI